MVPDQTQDIGICIPGRDHTHNIRLWLWIGLEETRLHASNHDITVDDNVLKATQKRVIETQRLFHNEKSSQLPVAVIERHHIASNQPRPFTQPDELTFASKAFSRPFTFLVS